jgi:Zn-dependent protease
LSSITLVCEKCSSELVPGALECGQCHTLAHAHAIEKIAARARAHEANGQLPTAREEWLSALRLLPPQSEHARWILAHANELGASIDSAHGHTSAGTWAKRLAPLGPLALLAAKFKSFFFLLFKFKSLFSFLAFMGVYWSLYGWQFGVGFAVLILVHEMGHYVEVKRRGLPAEMPVFLPGLGAYVKWIAMGVSLETRSAISLAGPMAGLLASGVCLIWWRMTGSGIAMALGHVSALLNVLNLIPVWVLDGGQAILALNRSERVVLALVSVSLWYFSGDMIFLLVAAGTVYRVFTKDQPEQPSIAITGYFVIVLAGLAWMLLVIPGKGLLGN